MPSIPAADGLDRPALGWFKRIWLDFATDRIAAWLVRRTHVQERSVKICEDLCTQFRRSGCAGTGVRCGDKHLLQLCVSIGKLAVVCHGRKGYITTDGCL